MKHAFFYLFVLILINACGDHKDYSGGPGSETTNSISTRILSPDGVPLPAARVIITPMDLSSSYIIHGTADAEGHFTINDIAPGAYWIRVEWQDFSRQQRVYLSNQNLHYTLVASPLGQIQGFAPLETERVMIPGNCTTTVDASGFYSLNNVVQGDIDLSFLQGDMARVMPMRLYSSDLTSVRTPSDWPALPYPPSPFENAQWVEPMASNEDPNLTLNPNWRGADYFGYDQDIIYPLLNQDGLRSLLLDDFLNSERPLLEPWSHSMWFRFSSDAPAQSKIEYGQGILNSELILDYDDSFSYSGFGFFFKMEPSQLPVDLSRAEQFTFKARGSGVVQVQWGTKLTDADGGWNKFHSTFILTPDWSNLSITLDTLSRLGGHPGICDDAKDSVTLIQWIWLRSDQSDLPDSLWMELSEPIIHGITLSDIIK